MPSRFNYNGVSYVQIKPNKTFGFLAWSSPDPTDKLPINNPDAIGCYNFGTTFGKAIGNLIDGMDGVKWRLPGARQLLSV